MGIFGRKGGWKRKIAKATGVPTTRGGRERKLGRLASGRGCLAILLPPFLVAITAALLIACGGGGTPPTKARRSPDAEKVSAADLSREYLADQAAAELKWHGKTIEVSGKVALTITDQEQPSAWLATDVNGMAVVCWFHKSRRDQVAALKPDQPVRVVGVPGKASVDAAKRTVAIRIEDCALLD